MQTLLCVLHLLVLVLDGPHVALRGCTVKGLSGQLLRDCGCSRNHQLNQSICFGISFRRRKRWRNHRYRDVHLSWEVTTSRTKIRPKQQHCGVTANRRKKQLLTCTCTNMSICCTLVCLRSQPTETIPPGNLCGAQEIQTPTNVRAVKIALVSSRWEMRTHQTTPTTSTLINNRCFAASSF